MHQAQWSPERPLPPPVSLASQSHREKPGKVVAQSLLLGGLALQNLLLSGTHVTRPSFNRICLTILFGGVTWEICHPEGGSASCHQGGFFGSRSPLLVHSQLTPKETPWGPEPCGSAWVPTPLLPGPSFQCPLQGHQELLPTYGRLAPLSWAGSCPVSVEKNKR